MFARQVLYTGLHQPQLLQPFIFPPVRPLAPFPGIDDSPPDPPPVLSHYLASPSVLSLPPPPANTVRTFYLKLIVCRAPGFALIIPRRNYNPLPDTGVLSHQRSPAFNSLVDVTFFARFDVSG